jgi:hypothetical protein
MARSRENLQATQPINWPEWLLTLGKRIHREIRRGAGIEEASKRLQSSLDTCKLGLVFYRASDVVKFRAMVEDWSRERMVLELGGVRRAIPNKQQAGTA